MRVADALMAISYTRRTAGDLAESFHVRPRRCAPPVRHRERSALRGDRLLPM